MIQDPAIAIVIDPWRTMAAGKVEIGCFRTYTNDYAEQLQKKEKEAERGGKGNSGALIPGDKFQDFGLHAHKYYQIPQ